ncbi:MAG TPA: DinB family protein [Vicinamibacterales bacterium]|nr:DinB family protein [Vicinamibacterales bacterium]
MTYYGGKQMADAFRTVRNNTIAIAEEVPAEKYDFRPAPDVRSLAEQLAHLAVAPRAQTAVHRAGLTSLDFAMFGKSMAEAAAAEQALRTKEDIVAALRDEGEAFASFLESLDEATLQESVNFPPPVQPSAKTRFEMLLGAKEHEMHHRGQLMVAQRMLGIVPHLTRRRQEMVAAAGGGKA